MPRKKTHIPDNSAEHNRRTFEYYAKPNRYDRTLRDYRDRLKSKYSKAYDANAAMLRDEYSHEVIPEHGLSIYAETCKHRLLLDAGQTDALINERK